MLLAGPMAGPMAGPVAGPVAGPSFDVGCAGIESTLIYVWLPAHERSTRKALRLMKTEPIISNARL